MSAIKKKKLLVFSVFFHPYVGGAEVALVEVFRRLNKKYDVHIITALRDLKLPRFELFEGMWVHRVGTGGDNDIRNFVVNGAKKARQLHRIHHFGTVYALMANWSAVACMVFLKTTRKKPQAVLNLQSGDSMEYIKASVPAGFWWLYKRIYTTFNTITTISSFLRERAIKFGAAPENVIIVPNGVDLRRFNSKKVPIKEVVRIKKKFGIKKKDVVVFTASRLAMKNNIDRVISAMNHLPKKYVFLIVGDGELKNDLKKQGKKSDSRVVFVDYVEHVDLPLYLSVADVFIRPSISEGFGNSFIEAMAMKVPVIATRVGGITDFIIDGVTGMFCDGYSEESIAENILMVCENQSLRKKIIREGLKKSKGYSWDKASKKLMKVLEKV